MYLNMDKICCIYLLINTLNNKIYIGQTINLKQRMSAYKYQKDKSKISRAIRKYGWNNFNMKIIEETNSNELDLKEKYWIRFYNSTNPDIGYNIEEGGKHPSRVNRKIKKNNISGENSVHAKFSIEQINEFREIFKSGNYSILELSKKLDIKYGTLHDILLNKHYHDPNYILEEDFLEQYKTTCSQNSTAKGVDNKCALFTEEQIASIREDFINLKHSIKELSEFYDVSYWTIQDIAWNRTYFNANYIITPEFKEKYRKNWAKKSIITKSIQKSDI